MNKNHVLRTFRNAGFPLDDGGYRYAYRSSPITIYYVTSLDELRVRFRTFRPRSFSGPKEALRWIERISAIQCVHSTDWALSADRYRARLELIAGGAA